MCDLSNGGQSCNCRSDTERPLLSVRRNYLVGRTVYQEVAVPTSLAHNIGIQRAPPHAQSYDHHDRHPFLKSLAEGTFWILRSHVLLLSNPKAAGEHAKHLAKFTLRKTSSALKAAAWTHFFLARSESLLQANVLPACWVSHWWGRMQEPLYSDSA